MYREIARPILDKVGHSEEMHHLVRDSLGTIQDNELLQKAFEKITFKGGTRFTSPRLKNQFGGHERENTMQLGAGWDKPGLTQEIFHILGFGGTVTGGITPRVQSGNPDRPRQHVFKKEEHYGEINFLGLNSDGSPAVAGNLVRYRIRNFPITASVAYNNTTEIGDIPADFCKVIEDIYDLVDGFQLLVSCPNVHGADYVHKLHDPVFLQDMAQTVNGFMDQLGRRKPTDIKTGGDVTMAELSTLIRICMDNGMGMVGINTSGNEDFKAHFGMRGVKGGFSGDYQPFRQRANEVAAFVYNETGGELNFTAAGAIYNGQDALERHLAGGRVLETVTGPRINGLTMADQTNRFLDKRLKERGAGNIEEIIGLDAPKYARKGYPNLSKA